MNWGNWLDEYDREARLVPALLALLPLVLAAVGLGIQRNPIVIALVAALFAVGVPVLAAKRVADRGHALEAQLFTLWGAPPTTLKLVPPVGGNSGEILRQRRARLENATGVQLPSAASLTDAEAEVYHVAVRWLIENTRDREKFPVIWKELKTYGFERNMLGLRPLGIVSSGIGASVLIVSAFAGVGSAAHSGYFSGLLGAACVVWGCGWAYIPSKKRVRAAADRYAERLLDGLALIS